MKKIYFFFLYILGFIIIESCVEPFDITTVAYERILVVEGKLTNELKQHKINLSRTIPLDSITLQPEINATVFVIDDKNQIFDFSEIEDGIYISNNTFSANANTLYTLKIELTDGSKYSSTPQQLTGSSEIESVTASIDENNLEIEKLNINVNGFSTDNTVNYYYYEYEETNEVSAPFFSFFTIDFSQLPAYSIVSKKPPLNQFCYNTTFSSGARLQTETLSLSENNISNFTVRSIDLSSEVLDRRYSILVKQFTQDFQAYSYHETLNSFTDFESVFAENQVGFIKGNIFNENNDNENVIGFFEVNSVTSERIFFNREDFFDSPSFYPVICDPDNNFLYLGLDTTSDGDILLDLYNEGFIYYANQLGDSSPVLVPRDCGDCGAFGSYIKPDWWID